MINDGLFLETITVSPQIKDGNLKRNIRQRDEGASYLLYSLTIHLLKQVLIGRFWSFASSSNLRTIYIK
jgi:hypothetical protein